MELMEEEGSNTSKRCPGCISSENASPKLLLYLEGHELDHALTLYQALIQQYFTSENNWTTSGKVWNQLYKITYRRAFDFNKKSLEQCSCHDSPSYGLGGAYLQYPSLFSGILSKELVSLNQSSPTYDMLYLLRCLEGINRLRFHIISRERIYAFANGRTGGNLDNLNATVSGVSQNEFVSCRIIEKLELQMRDALAIYVGGIPYWCSQLMSTCPFLFRFETKCKYFRLAAFNKEAMQQPLTSEYDDIVSLNGRSQSSGSYARKKILVHRDRILDSATEMMNLHAHKGVVLEVEYNDEVGTGLGPTLEFYTLVCHEFQKSGLFLWREDTSAVSSENLDAECSRNLVVPFGLFPRPWSEKVETVNGREFSDLTKKFILLGQIMAKALQDGRVLDIPFSKAFYKLILGKVNIFLIKFLLLLCTYCSFLYCLESS